MKIKVLAGSASEEVLREEFQKGKKAAEARLGEHFLFYRYFIRIRAIAYEEIGKAYLRIESGESGDLPVTEHYLMLIDKQGREHKLRMEHPEDAQEVLTYLREHFPEVEIGHYKKQNGCDIRQISGKNLPGSPPD